MSDPEFGWVPWWAIAIAGVAGAVVGAIASQAFEVDPVPMEWGCIVAHVGNDGAVLTAKCEDGQSGYGSFIDGGVQFYCDCDE